jgi:Mg2+ and Co2+ transporter CorA
LAPADGLVWIDLDHSDEQGMALLPQLCNVQPTDLEDCRARTPVPKLHLYPDHHFIAINGLSRGSTRRRRTPRMSRVPWNFGGGPMIIRRR